MRQYDMTEYNTSQRLTKRCCRLFVCVMVVVSIVWIPVIEQMQGGQLYIYIQSIAAYLAPPIASVYCMSILWPRANEQVTII